MNRKPLPWDDDYEPEQKQLPAQPKLLQISFAQPTKEGNFPALPANLNPSRIRSHLDQLAYNFLTTPGLIAEPLAEEDKANLTAAEIIIYEDIRQAMAPDAMQNKRQYWLDRMLPAMPKEVRATHVSGNVKDWRQTLRETAAEIDAAVAEAEILEENRWKDTEETEEIINVHST
jgi:hypothetical protein